MVWHRVSRVKHGAEWCGQGTAWGAVYWAKGYKGHTLWVSRVELITAQADAAEL